MLGHYRCFCEKRIEKDSNWYGLLNYWGCEPEVLQQAGTRDGVFWISMFMQPITKIACSFTNVSYSCSQAKVFTPSQPSRLT